MGWILCSALTSRIPFLLYCSKLFYPLALGYFADFSENWNYNLFNTHARLTSLIRRIWRKHGSELAKIMFIHSKVVILWFCFSLSKCSTLFGIITFLLTFSSPFHPEYLNLALYISWTCVILISMFFTQNEKSKELSLIMKNRVEDSPLLIKLEQVDSGVVALNWASQTIPHHLEIQFAYKNRDIWIDSVASNFSIQHNSKFKIISYVLTSTQLAISLALMLFCESSNGINFIIFIFCINTFLSFLVHSTSLSNPQGKVFVYGLPYNETLQIRLVNFDQITSEMLMASNVVEAKLFQPNKPNRFYCIYESATEYRSAPVCWSFLQQTKPALKNESSEIDSFKTTLRAAFFNPSEILCDEDSPDFLISMPLRTNQHVALSSKYINEVHNEFKHHQILRLHPSGSHIPSYTYNSDIWNFVNILGSKLPAQICVLFFSLTFILQIILDLPRIHNIMSLFDLIAFGNISYLLIIIISSTPFIKYQITTLSLQ